MSRILVALLLAALVTTALPPAAVAEQPGWVVEEPVAADAPPGRRLAVILSGDGGWADLDRDLAAIIVARGIPVLGVNALKYFWTRRTPEEAAADLAVALGDAMARWGRDEVILIGFSFGASVLPAIANRLPPEVRAKVATVALLTSYTWANWEIHVGGWFRDDPDDHATDVEPEARRLGLPLLCVYGVEEAAKSICPRLADMATVVEKPGGHHFDYDYDALAELVLEHAAAHGAPR